MNCQDNRYMIKKLLMLMSFALVMVSCAAQDGKVTIRLPKGYKNNVVVVSSAEISNMLTARRESDLKIKHDTLKVVKNVAEMNLSSAPSRYSIDLMPEMSADFYASKGDNLNVDITSLNPLEYTVKGTDLMDGMTELATLTAPIEAEYYALTQSGNATADKVMPIMERYDVAVKDFIAKNPQSPAVPYAMLDLQGNDFLEAYSALTPAARESIIMPMVESKLPSVRRQVEAEKQREEIMSGTALAPDFTLPDLQGRKVSLSDYRGKWVVIDFWGSWCGWCIKGFPKLKDAYKQYGDKLVVIGVDCNETEDAWRAGVKKYELPWVNVYCGEANASLLSEYGITGFPTKGIVDPEGHLVDLTVGEDPSFFDRLARFIGE